MSELVDHVVREFKIALIAAPVIALFMSAALWWIDRRRHKGDG